MPSPISSASSSPSRHVELPVPDTTHASPVSPAPTSAPSVAQESPISSRRSVDATGAQPRDDTVDLPPRSAAPQSPVVDSRASAQAGASGSRLTDLVGGVAGALGTAGSAALQGLSSTQKAVVSAMEVLWSLSDLRTMLQPHGDDRSFLAVLRGAEPGPDQAFTFARCREQLTALRGVVQGEPGIEPRFKKTLMKDIEAIERAIDPLQHGTSASGRAAKALLNLVNLWPVIVPSPLLANQAKTFAYTVAAAAKAVVGVAGTTLRPTADGLPFPLGGGELGRQSDEVHFYPALLNAIFLSVEMSKRYGSESVRHHAEAVDHSKVAHAGFAAAAGTILIAPFVWGSIRNGAAKAVALGANAVAAGMDKAGFSSQAGTLRRQFTPGQVGEAVHAELSQLWQGLEDGRKALQQARRDFTDPESGHELTRTLNSQCTHLLASIAQCTKRLDQAFHLGAAQESTAASISREPQAHPDFASKLALTLFAAGVTGTTVYLIQPDPIGTVDLAADSVVVTAVMAQSAWNRQTTRQDAMERFKGMAATSMVMAIALTADKLSKQFTPKGMIESSASAPYYASLVMTAMAMTMPGPVARGAELAMNWGGGQIAALGSQVINLFKGPDGQTLATMTPRSPEELLAQVARIGSYVDSLPEEQRAAYDQIAGESIRRSIDQASASPARASGVSIEEIVTESA
ncbi:hypothetical protein SAMN05428960_0377 [Mitsuaria sp. PDC51]|uniref:XopX family type III secretion system effector n=1 Tax=Mitsuaria sp. PDC51 TaxID=1881035 RepID=UPI0008ED80E2|nr:XopX family type III secretion system effector [Mitsuaria sp. PDC51]SFR71371.1 hypothetical protein SAMN05428960_0377 [Mitsuaria sp. PDC51]